jgi:hypothetical protein
MHQIVLLTAMTATTGLFGGGRSHCTTGRCGQAAPVYSTCQPGTACANGGYYYAAPRVAAAPTYAPGYAAPQAPRVAAAPVARPAAPATAYYPSYYYPTTATANCPNGTCYQR